MRAAKNDLVVVMNRDPPDAVLVGIEQLGIADLPRRPLDPQSTLFQHRDAVGVEGDQIEIVQDGEDAAPPLARPWRR